MTSSLLLRATAGALLALAAADARAINEMFAKDAPLARMTAEDLRLAREALQRALDQGRDGEEFQWQNPGTSASGTVTPLSTFEKQGLKCRGLAFSLTARGETSRTGWNVCRTPDGWKVAEGR